jgi:pyruvate-formate lyase-activating enzyme
MRGFLLHGIICLMKCDWCDNEATSFDSKHLCQYCYSKRQLKEKAYRILYG